MDFLFDARFFNQFKANQPSTVTLMVVEVFTGRLSGIFMQIFFGVH